MATACVFPGGQVEAADVQISAQNTTDGALRCAAIRETFEEAGLLFASASPADAVRDAARKQLLQQKSSSGAFKAYLEEWQAKPSTAALFFMTCFITPDFEASRMPKGGFEAHFFIAQVSDASEATRATGDGAEVESKVLWASPSEALRRAENDSISLAPPQWYILRELQERMPRLAGLKDFLADSKTALFQDYPMKPHPVKDGGNSGKGSVTLALPGDSEHPTHTGKAGWKHRIHCQVGENRLFKCHRLERVGSYPAEAFVSISDMPRASL